MGDMFRQPKSDDKNQNEDSEKLRADKTFGIAVCGDVLSS